MKRYGNYDIELISVFTNRLRKEVLKIGGLANSNDTAGMIDAGYGLIKFFIKDMTVDSTGEIVPGEQIEDCVLDMAVEESQELFKDIVDIVKDDDTTRTFLSGILFQENADLKKSTIATPENSNTL